MNRRGFLIGLGATLAAPAIVRAVSLMTICPLPTVAASKTDLGLWLEAMQWHTRRPKLSIAADQLAILSRRHASG